MKWIFTPLLILSSILSFASAPTVAASNLYFNAIDGGYFNIGWTSGNGARRIMVAKAGSAPTFTPQNGIDYTSSDVFGQGQEVAPGEFIVFDHFSSSFYLTGLSAATTYFFRVFEYNGTGSTTEYLTSSYLSGSGTTSATPTVQTTNATFPTITTNSVTISWTNGNGARRLIVVKEGSAVNADPVSGTAYAVNSVFGNGATTGAGNYTVYNGSSTSTSITNLKQGTQYYFAFYEFNGSQQPQYKTPAYTTTVTTRSMPTVASSGVSIIKTDGKELTLNWTNGNGQRRIIVARQGSDVGSVPVNGTDYNANATFGLGQQLGSGEYVVYDDNFNVATISGLNPATTYYFKIFEYDGTGSNTIYLTSSFGSINGSTAVTPTVQTTFLPPSNITSSSVQLNFTSGNGRARLLIGRKGAAVNVTPVDLTGYIANSDFGSGQDLGNGNFVLFNSTDASVNVHNLDANSVYHFAVFEFNGFNEPLYLSPSATADVTTSGILPVKLISWKASNENGKLILQWKTGMETNASHFEIERSSDGNHFSPIAIVAAAGASQTEVSYSKEDSQPLQGKAYYRLKMVDNDGSFQYSNVLTITTDSKATARILQNPVQNLLQIEATGNTKNWQIINSAGQVMKSGTVSGGKATINVSTLAAGKYWLRIQKGNEVNQISFLKQ